MASKSTINVRILGDASNLTKTLATTQGQVSAWSGKVARLGVAAAAGVVAGGAAAAVGLFKVGQSFDAEFDKIRTGTGATGDALAGLEGSFKNVLKTVPASFGDAGTAIADLNTRLGLSGKPLEELSGQFINLSRITKTDLSGNIDNITRVFGDWEIAGERQAESLDKIYRASQASGIGIDDLSTSVVNFGAPLRNLGFGFDESLALLGQFNKTGVNTETVFAGLKAGVGKLAKEGEPVPETFRRVVDEITQLGPGTEATALAIELFGQRAGPDLADAIAGGKFEVEEMLAAVAGGEDTIAQAAKDTESFSEKWSRFKNRVLVGLQPLATKVFDGVGKLMDELGPKVEPVVEWFSEKIPVAVETVRKVFQRNWPKIRTTIANVFDWLVDKVWPRVSDVFEGIVDGVEKVVDFFNKNRGALIGLIVAIGIGFAAWAVSAAAAAAATLAAAAPFIAIGAAVAAIAVAFGWAYENVDWFRDAVDTVARFFVDTVWPILQETWKVIQEVVSSIVGWIVENWDTISAVTMTVFNAIRDYLQGLWDSIYAIVDGALQVIRGVIKTVTSLISGDFSGAWDGIKMIVSGAIDAVVGWVQGLPARIFGVSYTAFDALRNAATSMKDWIGNRITDVVNFAIGLPGRMSGIFSGMWDGIKWAFRAALNWVIDRWNGLEFRVPGFSAFGQTIGGFTLGVPDIPRFHDGGIVPGPRGSEMLAILEAGERVTSARDVERESSGGGNVYITAPAGVDVAWLQRQHYARTGRRV